jgi:asparagine synthase (glutamine-hydrolysing)
MAHSVETRQPFLDYRLVEWLFSRGSELKIHRGETKWILREYLRGRRQQEIAGRSMKLGYLTPADEWLAANNGAIPREYLLGSDSATREYCVPSRVERLIELHRRGATGVGHHLYRLLSTEMWLRQCIRVGQPSSLLRGAA